MSRKSLFALILVVATMISAPLLAQEREENTGPTSPPEQTGETGEKTFRLSRGTTSAEDELAYQEEVVEAWDPHIEAGTVEVSFAFGFLSLTKTIWEHSQIIYKYNTEATYWGDVEITGETAFNPAVRIGYNLTRWFSVEGVGGISFSEYGSTIENRFTRENKPGSQVVPDPPLGEYDAETRSTVTTQASLNAVLYPLNIAGDGYGRWHPYLTAGGGAMWYDLNSNYFAGPAGSVDVNFGGGIRLLADRNISVRAEVLFHMNEVQFDVAPYFMELNEGTTIVPINEYPIQPDGSFVEQPVKEYSSQTMSLINLSIGVHGSF